MKKRMLSVALALCLCVSSQSVAFAWQGDSLPQIILQGEGEPAPAAVDVADLTPTNVYNAMIALKDQAAYQEGTPWTNDEPYSDSKGYYRWKGGPLGGANIVAVGCVAFAFILSDTAFGELPARMYAAGQFTYEDIKVGDILRVNNDVHTVIVLEANEAGVVVAEGNISTGDHKGKVHWGRTISKADVMRDTSHYITRYPENYVAPDDPTANEIVAQGTLDGGLTWKLTRAGTLTISGNGAMPDWSTVADQPWAEKNSSIRKVVIEEGVTAIGACAFWQCDVLSVDIPSTVTSIGNNAFYKSSVISVTIPSGVKTVGDSAFRECANLSSVTVSEGVETIGQNAFRACASLPYMKLPVSIREVGNAAFFQCTKLTGVTFVHANSQAKLVADPVKMGDNLFTRCYNLMGVTLPESIDRISEGMFQNCLMLTGVEIPQGTESIGGSAFASCSRLSVVAIPSSVKSIGAAAFSASNLLKKIYFTGTKAEWEAVNKGGAIITSDPTIFYNYVPGSANDIPNGDIGGGDTNTPGGDNNTPGGDTNTPGGGDTNTPGGDNNTPGGDTNTPGGDTNTPGGGNNTPGGDTTPPGGGGGNDGGSSSGGGGGVDYGPTEEPKKEIDISDASVTLSETEYLYDGKAKNPVVIVTAAGKILTCDTDFTVFYDNNIEPGTATVRITGKGDYVGSQTVTFTIRPVTVTCKKTVYEVAYGADSFVIDASSEGKLTFVSANPKVAEVNKETGAVTVKNTGIATITVTAADTAKKVTVKVSPKKQLIKAVKAAKGNKLTVEWTKDKKASGYQVQISTDKSFKKNVKSKKLGQGKTTWTFAKLKPGKKYYVRVRSYKKSGKETLYGTWSKIERQD